MGKVNITYKIAKINKPFSSILNHIKRTSFVENKQE